MKAGLPRAASQPHWQCQSAAARPLSCRPESLPSAPVSVLRPRTPEGQTQPWRGTESFCARVPVRQGTTELQSEWEKLELGVTMGS